MSNDTSYFKIGSFVLVGLGLIIFALLIFGSSKLFQPVVYIETYFEESIQGISEGTPVKYRGLQIGYIKKIAFTSEIYGDGHKGSVVEMHDRSIYVRIAITSKLFTQLSNDEVRQFLSKEVAQGLRVKLVAQGLTGVSYLELNYVNPIPPLHPITWHTRDFYMPSVTSTLTRLSENAQYIMNELKDINFKKLFQDINLLTVSLTQVASKTDNSLSRINNPLAITMQNFKIVSNNLRMLSEQLKLNPSSMVFGSPPPPLDPSKL
ncbi:MlaD domain-containing protein [Gammaproteobacteria bacterium]